jgi:transposase
MVGRTRGRGSIFAPYSPDFTPVEQAWSKLKAAWRHLQVRTQLALEEALQTALPWITPTDARHWFHHCGYHVHRS